MDSKRIFLSPGIKSLTISLPLEPYGAFRMRVRPALVAFFYILENSIILIQVIQRGSSFQRFQKWNRFKLRPLIGRASVMAVSRDRKV